MPFVLTVDQIDSRRQGDFVDPIIHELAGIEVLLPFTRTVGDEFQGLLDDPLSVVTAILILMRNERWHIGLGLGSVEQPLPADPRSARGDAFIAARSAVDRAKSDPSHLAVESAHDVDEVATDAQTVFRLVAALRSHRTDQGWQALELVQRGLNQQETAARLGITRQAVSQRLQTAHWSTEQAAVATLGRMLARADRVASP